MVAWARKNSNGNKSVNPDRLFRKLQSFITRTYPDASIYARNSSTWKNLPIRLTCLFWQPYKTCSTSMWLFHNFIGFDPNPMTNFRFVLVWRKSQKNNPLCSAAIPIFPRGADTKYILLSPVSLGHASCPFFWEKAGLPLRSCSSLAIQVQPFFFLRFASALRRDSGLWKSGWDADLVRSQSVCNCHRIRHPQSNKKWSITTTPTVAAPAKQPFMVSSSKIVACQSRLRWQ